MQRTLINCIDEFVGNDTTAVGSDRQAVDKYLCLQIEQNKTNTTFALIINAFFQKSNINEIDMSASEIND